MSSRSPDLSPRTRLNSNIDDIEFISSGNDSSDVQNIENGERAGTQGLSRQSPPTLKGASPSATELLACRSTGMIYSPSTVCRKIGSSFIPNAASRTVDQMESRGYIGQYTPNGDLFIGAFQNEKVIKIYDPQREFSVVKVIHARTLRWTITDCAASPDCRFVIYSSITPFVHLANMQNEDNNVESIANVTDIHETLHFLDSSHSSGIWSVKWSGDSREIIAGSSECSVCLYDIPTQRVISVLKGHQNDVNSVEYADETNTIFFSASDDSYVYVWDRRLVGKKSKPVGALVGHTEGIAHLSSKGDSRYLISNAKDQTVKCWDLRSSLVNWNEAKKERTKLDVPTFDWDYRWMEFPGDGMDIKHPRDRSVLTLRGHKVLGTLCRAYWSPLHTTGQKYIYSGSADGNIYIYDTVDGKEVERLEHHGDVVRDCSWHPYLPIITSVSFDGSIVQWEHSYDHQTEF